jgi:hypothetical protein
MRQLSISAAWDETKAILAHDGRLLMTVALALVALPSVVNGLLNPSGMTGTSAPWLNLVAFLASVIALAGQLALIRLALGPSITVGGAIAHGFARLPIYFVAVLMLVIALFLIAIPCVLLLSLLGVPLDAKPVQMSGPLAVVALVFLAVAIFLGVRLILSPSVASAEEVGPIAILRRSWQLTSHHFWQLLGFLLVFLVSSIVLIIAVGSALGVAIGLLLGSIQPMSVGALILALVQALVSTAISTIFAVMLARIYLQLAGRRDVQEVFR